MFEKWCSIFSSILITRAELIEKTDTKRRTFLLVFLTPGEGCSQEIGEALTPNWTVHGLVTSAEKFHRSILCHLDAELVPSVSFVLSDNVLNILTLSSPICLSFKGCSHWKCLSFQAFCHTATAVIVPHRASFTCVPPWWEFVSSQHYYVFSALFFDELYLQCHAQLKYCGPKWPMFFCCFLAPLSNKYSGRVTETVGK